MVVVGVYLLSRTSFGCCYCAELVKAHLEKWEKANYLAAQTTQIRYPSTAYSLFNFIEQNNNITLPNTPYTKQKGRNMGLRSGTGGGEIVQVQGGHIIRATGRKDRHSKVFTAKGPRDRRVRLSAHTAIQFYDVQDRLGYDRPSKAVDWLLKKAKASIDKLAELPPWDPSTAAAGVSHAGDGDHDHANIRSTDIHVADHPGTSYHNQQLHSSSSAYVVDSQPLSDSMMKSFFPTTSEENPTINFQNYPHDLISRGSFGNQSQDLCLSLHTTLQDQGGNTHHQHSSNDQTLFQGSLGFDGGWAEPQSHQDLGRFTRLMGWAGGGAEAAARGGTLFNPSQMPPPQSAYNNFQRGALQSSFSPFLVQNHQNSHSSISGIGHGSEGFMGFSIPSHIHGDHHQLHGGVSMSNSASSSSMSPDSSQH
ncbi:hypothetical protein Cgig2_008362 [Carnegiea gigantea]|uniref:TCP domain-containing protein n=1 Tax=Carnegiea gigantea TaxID=171969 RepID=A0A9Q1QFK0_9CARY|nr:hypothetical protein Cgig2_008362 [Carnegiea gigantea]